MSTPTVQIVHRGNRYAVRSRSRWLPLWWYYGYDGWQLGPEWTTLPTAQQSKREAEADILFRWSKVEVVES